MMKKYKVNSIIIYIIIWKYKIAIKILLFGFINKLFKKNIWKLIIIV